MKVRDILKLYDYYCSCSILDLNHNNLWTGWYDDTYPNKPEYKQLKRYLDYEVCKLSTFQNDIGKLQIFINKEA